MRLPEQLEKRMAAMQSRMDASIWMHRAVAKEQLEIVEESSKLKEEIFAWVKENAPEQYEGLRKAEEVIFGDVRKVRVDKETKA